VLDNRFHFFSGCLTQSDELARLSHQLTTAPEYLLKSLTLTKNVETLRSKSEAARHQREPSARMWLIRDKPTYSSFTPGGGSLKWVKTENQLVTSWLASSLTENRILKQNETYNSHQKTPQTCVATGEIASTSSDAPLLCSTTTELTNAVVEPRLVKKELDRKRRFGGERKVTSVSGKPKPKPAKKLRLAVTEAESDRDVSRFELPNYQLRQECAHSEKTELFGSSENEATAYQLQRPLVDVTHIKVDDQMLSA